MNIDIKAKERILISYSVKYSNCVVLIFHLHVAGALAFIFNI